MGVHDNQSVFISVWECLLLGVLEWGVVFTCWELFSFDFVVSSVCCACPFIGRVPVRWSLCLRGHLRPLNVCALQAALPPSHLRAGAGGARRREVFRCVWCVSFLHFGLMVPRFERFLMASRLFLRSSLCRGVVWSIQTPVDVRICIGVLFFLVLAAALAGCLLRTLFRL